MAAPTTSVTLDVGHVFPPGTNVKAFDRVSDFIAGHPQGEAQGSTRVKAGGVVELDGLLSNGQFWLCGETTENVQVPASPEFPDGLKPEKRFRAVSFVAADESLIPVPDERHLLPHTVAQADREREAQAVQVDRSPSVDQSPAPGESVAHRIREGARSTESSKPSRPDTPPAEPKSSSKPKPKRASTPKK